LLIRGSYVNGKFTGKGFSLCNKVEGGWSAPEKLNIKGYENMAVDAYSGATMANDGKTLLLYFSEEKNSNLNDIYVSRLNEDAGEWSKPVKLADNINMDDYDEISPFLAADGVTLYFSSDRPGGKGDYDIKMFSKDVNDSQYGLASKVHYFFEPIREYDPSRNPVAGNAAVIDSTDAEY
jgi:hypothetical protein